MAGLATGKAMADGGRHPVFLAIGASGAVLLASFVNFLRYNDYPLIAPEVGLVLLGLLVLVTLVSLLHARERVLGKALLEALLVFLLVDQNGGGARWAGAAALVVGGVVLVRRQSALPFLGVAAGVAILVGLLGIGDRVATAANRAASADRGRHADGAVPPALLHIILDEHVGIAGLPADNPRTPRIAATLRSFYLSRGFRLYGRAYSDHLHTVNAVPQMLNFGETQPPDDTPSDGRVLGRNAYFDALARQDYRIVVHESDFMDFCGNAAVVRCERYPAASLAPLADALLSAGDKARLIATRFAILSPTIDMIGKLYRALGIMLGRRGIALSDLDLPLEGRTSALNALDGFDDLIADVRHAAPGRAYFAHILLPHYPYALDPNCRVRPLDAWQLRRSVEPLRRRQDADLDQILCATRKVSETLEAIRASPAGDNFIAVIQGDHGSRVTQIEPIIENVDRLDRADLVAGFATLLAIRAPKLGGGYVSSPMPVGEALGASTGSGFAVMPMRSNRPRPSVILDDRGWIPRKRVPFPKRW